jgi:putative tricarboxylic transport membrane protein
MKIDRIISLVLVLVALVVLAEGLRLPYQIRATPGPGFFPIWISSAMIGLSLLLAVTTRRADRPFIDDPTVLKKVGAVLGAFLLFIFLIGYLGTTAAMAIFIALVAALVEKRSWREWVPFALVISVGAHLLFKTWLGVPLPGGLLGL